MKRWRHPKYDELRAAIQARDFSPAMKLALVRILRGETYRPAARAEGVNLKTLHQNAASVPGLQAAHLEAWEQQWGRAFPAVWRHLVVRVPDRPRRIA